MSNERNGSAVVVVLFFAFAIATVLFVMISSNANLAAQNKKTLMQLQAYYLAQSGLQHARLKLRLLPKETFDLFAAGSVYDVRDLDSSGQVPLNMSSPAGQKYTLFGTTPPGKQQSPYKGKYWVESGDLRMSSSHKSYAMVQDGYFLKINAEISLGTQKNASDTVEEEVIVSRFSGGS